VQKGMVLFVRCVRLITPVCRAPAYHNTEGVVALANLTIQRYSQSALFWVNSASVPVDVHLQHQVGGEGQFNRTVSHCT